MGSTRKAGRVMADMLPPVTGPTGGSRRTRRPGAATACDHAGARDNGGVTSRPASETRVPDAAVAARLRERYPRSRLPRPLLVGLIAAGAIIALAWLLWAGYVHATPPVAAQVTAYAIPDDHRISLTLTVQRRQPATAASCRVVAQAADYQTVGEQQVRVPPGRDRLTGVDVTLVTLRRATTALVESCTAGG